MSSEKLYSCSSTANTPKSLPNHQFDSQTSGQHNSQTSGSSSDQESRKEPREEAIAKCNKDIEAINEESEKRSIEFLSYLDVLKLCNKQYEKLLELKHQYERHHNLLVTHRCALERALLLPNSAPYVPAEQLGQGEGADPIGFIDNIVHKGAVSEPRRNILMACPSQVPYEGKFPFLCLPSYA